MTYEEKLDKYYKCVGIAPVDSKSSYEEMFSKFQCKKKEDCRTVCCKAWNQEDCFRFSPPLTNEGGSVSQTYQDGKYRGDPIPRIVVISLSVPKPEPRPPCSTGENKSLNPHWRGTTTTIRSLFDPFIKLKPAGNWDDKSTKTIEQLFVHVRTGKCSSNANGKGQEPYRLYENCGGYLSKEVSILEPDVVVTQGNAAHDMAKKHVFDEGAKGTPVENVEGIADSDSIARIVHLKEDNRKLVYWLRSYFPYGRFYSRNHAGPKIDCESNVVGAKRKNLVLYGKDIKRFINNRQGDQMERHSSEPKVKKENVVEELTPYRTFKLCGDRREALNRRTTHLLNALAKKVNLESREGYYLFRQGKIAERVMIQFQYDRKCLEVSLAPADTVTQARCFYKKMDKEAFLSLKEWTIKPNLHFSFARTHLIWATTDWKTRNYFDRFSDGSFGKTLQDELLALAEQWEGEDLISSEDREKIKDQFKNTERQSLNVVPGFLIYREWKLNTVIEWEEQGKLEEHIIDALATPLATWGEELCCRA